MWNNETVKFNLGASGLYYVLSENDLGKIRALVAEEIKKALRPEQQGKSATVIIDGEKWSGTVYRVEDGEEE